MVMEYPVLKVVGDDRDVVSDGLGLWDGRHEKKGVSNPVTATGNRVSVILVRSPGPQFNWNSNHVLSSEQGIIYSRLAYHR